jgi:hypothetical protein
MMGINRKLRYGSDRRLTAAWEKQDRSFRKRGWAKKGYDGNYNETNRKRKRKR